MKARYLILLTAMIATQAVAADDAKKEKSPWTLAAELGYISTTGNTETTTAAGKFDATYEVDRWRDNLHLEAYGQQAKDETTGETVTSAERYEGSGKTDYKFSDRDYAFALLKLKKDRFSGFEYENSFSVGYGRSLIKDEDMQLDVEIGPGYRWYKVDNAPDSKDEAVLRMSGDYWWKVTEHSKFTQKLTTEIGSEYTTSESITGISANINSTLALKLTYTVRHKSKVPEDTKKTDTETAVTLVFNY
jgi:putative salt-induced outer membrane protein